ncbi:MAG: HAMP domain-containing sensor histidine kinase [Actinomycetes bacterium]
MSDISFKALRQSTLLDWLFGAFCVLMLLAMFARPGQETVPYHLLFFALAVVYGFRVWPPGKTIWLIVVISVVSGVAMVLHWQQESIEAAELIEVLLMPALIGAMVWHAHRHAVANRLLQSQARERMEALVRQRELLRDACHAMRTPVTIARGHIDLLEMETADATTNRDLEIVRTQIDRMGRMTSRLIALTELDRGDALLRQPTDVAGFVSEIGFNWTATAPRQWQIEEAHPVLALVDREYLEIAVDALVENALNYTSDDDAIRVECRQEAADCVIEVGDAGPGIEPDDRRRVFDRYWHRPPPDGAPGSGLGLAAVRSIVLAHGGDVEATSAREGGALIRFRIPVATADELRHTSVDLREQQSLTVDRGPDTWSSVRHLQP